MKKSLNTSAVLVLLFSFGSGHAAGYIGASVGATSPEEEGFDDSNGYRITLGFDVNSNIAIEASYTNLGEFDADDDTIAALEFLTGVALDDASVEGDGIEFAVVGKAPLSDVVSVFGKAGIFVWDAEYKIDTVSFGSDSDTEDGTDPFFGVGVSFDIGQAVAFNVEYTLYDVDDADIDYIGAGVSARF